MSFSKKISRLKWKALDQLPTPLRYFLIRKIFKITYDLPSDLTFKIADTSDEIEQALRILHDGYVEKKLMDPSHARIRITKYHFLPTTTILIAKKRDEVIATLTLIRDSHLKLPTDACWNLTDLRNEGLKLMEVSSLAIKKEYQSQGGPLLFPLCKFMWEYAYKYAKVDALVISTHPSVKDFYRGILMFEPLDQGKVSDYEFVKGAKGVAQWLDLRTAINRYQETYGTFGKQRNLHHFFTEHSFSNFKFPNRTFYTVSDPVWNPEMMRHFIKCCPDIFMGLSIKEKTFLRETFFFNEFKEVIGHHESEIEILRKNIRFPVHCPSRLVKGESINSVLIEDASRNGFRLKNKSSLNIGDEVRFKVEIGPGQQADIQAKVAWSTIDWVGLSILTKSDSWDDFIDHLEVTIRKQIVKQAS